MISNFCFNLFAIDVNAKPKLLPTQSYEISLTTLTISRKIAVSIVAFNLDRFAESLKCV